MTGRVTLRLKEGSLSSLSRALVAQALSQRERVNALARCEERVAALRWAYRAYVRSRFEKPMPPSRCAHRPNTWGLLPGSSARRGGAGSWPARGWHAPVLPAPSKLCSGRCGRVGTAPSRESSTRRWPGDDSAAAAGDAAACGRAALQQRVRVGQAARGDLHAVRRGTCVVSASCASSTPTLAHLVSARRCIGRRPRHARCTRWCVRLVSTRPGQQPGRAVALPCVLWLRACLVLNSVLTRRLPQLSARRERGGCGLRSCGLHSRDLCGACQPPTAGL